MLFGIRMSNQPFHNLLEKGWTKTQPFRKRLDQNTTFFEKVGPKFTIKLCVNLYAISVGFWSNLFLKGCVLVQPFPKRLCFGPTFS
jgi:hypothetical protein